MSRVCLIGLDQEEITSIQSRLSTQVLAHDLLPKIRVRDGELYVSSDSMGTFLPVSKVVFHGIFEHDHDLISGLALWGGPCLPDARAMMDCRLKLPCLVRALQFTEFGAPARGFVSRETTYHPSKESVAKWGNWHCGENKFRFESDWTSNEPSIIEPFIEGTAVRVVLIGDRAWQIQLEGDSWLKSIHHASAAFMGADEKLVRDTRKVAQGFGLEIMANDYIVDRDGLPHLLEVNHIPNVTRFPEIWSAYADYVVDWCESTLV